MVEFNQEQSEALKFYYDEFKSWERYEEIRGKRQQRSLELKKILAKDSIDNLTVNQIDKAYGLLWSVDKRFEKELTKHNKDISKIRKTLKYLLYEDEDPFTKFEKVNNDPKYKLKTFSDSRISELFIKINSDSNISLVNKRIIELVKRLDLDISFEKDSLAEKAKAYDLVVKSIQKQFQLKDLDETDMFIWFIDEFDGFFPAIEEPLPREKKLKKVNFSFTKEDFQRTKGTKEDAKYLRKRFQIFNNALIENLGDEFSNWESYVNRINQQGKRIYRTGAWTGFVHPDAIHNRPQESIQLQASLNSDEIAAVIWISFVGRAQAKKVQKTISDNKEAFLQILQNLPPDFYIGVWNRKTSTDTTFSMEEINKETLDQVLTQMSESNTDFYLGPAWEPESAIKKGSKIVSEIAEVFQQLIPAYYFVNGLDADLPPTQTSSSFDSFSQILNQKGQVILYGPPGTSKTRTAKELAINRITNRKIIPNDVDETFDNLQKSGYAELVQFHPSYSYEDFVEGIRPTVNSKDSSKLTYKVQDGIFKLLCYDANESLNDVKEGIDHHYAIISNYISFESIKPQKFGLQSQQGGIHKLNKTDFQKIVNHVKNEGHDTSSFDDINSFNNFFDT